VDALRSFLQSTPVGEGMNPELLTGMAALLFATLVLVGVALAGLIFTWAERKVAGYIQSRYGPMYTGPGMYHGLLQPIADGVKLLLKEDIWPADADKLLFRLGPLLVFTGAFMSFVVLPFSPTWVGANLDMGLLYVFATSSLVVTGVLAAGWGSNNKWSLYGAMRGAAQVISYEIPLGLAVLPIVMHVGSLNMGTLVESQAGYIWNWNLVNPIFAVAFLIYLISLHGQLARRGQPRALRPAGDRERARERVPHRIHRDEVRLLLPGRVRGHVRRFRDRRDRLPRGLVHRAPCTGRTGPSRAGLHRQERPARAGADLVALDPAAPARRPADVRLLEDLHPRVARPDLPVRPVARDHGMSPSSDMS
jgi:hypothetical protein